MVLPTAERERCNFAAAAENPPLSAAATKTETPFRMSLIVDLLAPNQRKTIATED
jgi:hypothetical protein